jgi:transcription initiation factor TFIIIB Brf1 subunit/transcription initiation factor TFIIB
MSTELFPGIGRSIAKNTAFSEKEIQMFQDEDASARKEHITHCSNCGTSFEECDQEDLIVCSGCGDVLERLIDLGAEYRFFGHDDRSSIDPCRVGAPVDKRFPSSTLGTIILSRSSGGPASAGKAMARIRRYHTWSMIPYKERSLLQVFEQFALTATNFGINTRAIDTAKELYIQLVEHCDRRGMSRNCVVASSIYASLKMVGEPRKPKEIADMFHLTTAQFTKSYKYFQEVLALAKQRGQIADALAPASQASTRASDYITHPLSKLPVARGQYTEIQFKAMAVADKAEDILVSPENMPPSLAAGVLAFVLSRMNYADIPLARIASVCNVSEGTLTKCLKRLEAQQESLWPLE